jgi:hypothetical protein
LKEGTAETILKMAIEEVQVIFCPESLAQTATQLPKLTMELIGGWQLWQLGNILRDQSRTQWGERGRTGGRVSSGL